MSKPMGAIPADFASAGPLLSIGGRNVDAIVADAGDTPLFVYDLGIVDARVTRFKAVMPANVDLHYAVKANPYEAILRQLARKVEGFDVASAGEMKLALAAGMKAESISFAGPGKRDNELAEAIRAEVTINCESELEARRAIALGQQLSVKPRLAVRVNPDFEIKGSGMRMGGGAKPFGVDAERVPSLVRSIIDGGADWRGFHIFVGSQALNAEAIVEAQRATVELAGVLADAVGVTPPLVNLGGGFGIPYFHGEQPLDIAPIGRALGDVLERRAASLADSAFAIELGRWLVGECGVYLTRVVDRKVSHGKTFLIVDGGMHHQLAASGNFGQVVRRNYPVAIATRFNAPAVEEVSIVGCLCTPLDRLADDVIAPAAGVGDIVAVFMAGAYGLSASPQAFLGQQPALELAVSGGD